MAATLSKRILTVEDLDGFKQSSLQAELVQFIEALSESCRGKSLRAEVTRSGTIDAVVEILDKISGIVKQVPPVDTASRFGNAAFREFYDRVEERSPELVAPLLKGAQKVILEGNDTTAEASGSTLRLDSAKDILAGYLSHSFGDRARIDYGSGHELTFLCFLFALNKLERLKIDQDAPALVLVVFWRYVKLMRVIQQTYWLEPAGSHGVWGLDDYHFLPFLFGSSQLAGHPILRPKGIHDEQILDDFGEDYIYLACIKFINSIKTASLRWHSPMLDDISGVKQWSKVNTGLVKMYKAEVLGKLPIMQHFIFSSLLDFTPLSPAETWRTIDDHSASSAHEHTTHSHSQDCCGIPIPSAFAEAAASRRQENKVKARGIAHGQIAGVVPVTKTGGIPRPLPFD